VPSTIFFIAYDAAQESVEIAIPGVKACPECDRWQVLRRSGIKVDFRRLRRFCSDLPSLSDCLFDFSGLMERSDLNVSDEISTQLSQELSDDHCIIVKSMNLSACDDKCNREKTIESIMNLRHPCLSGIIGVVLPSQLNTFEIVGMHFDANSLPTIISTSPLWWTATAKVKAIAGLVLGLRFAHSFGILHGHLTGNDIFLAEDGVIQITGFGLNGIEAFEGYQGADGIDGRDEDLGGFSGANWTPKQDIRAFTGIFSKIVIGTSCEHGCSDSTMPLFVRKMIERGESSDSKAIGSFSDILTILKKDNFKIMDGVDTEEVSHFVKWIEWSERLIE
jgi:hypothetical protein